MSNLETGGVRVSPDHAEPIAALVPAPDGKRYQRRLVPRREALETEKLQTMYTANSKRRTH